MYRSPNLEFVVNQSIWNEGDVRFADIILPACTNLERYDISEWANSAGYGAHFNSQVNHRIITFQNKCIEPLGESRSDYDIFASLSCRLGLGNYFTEGMRDIDWVKRMFDASDLARAYFLAFISQKRLFRRTPGSRKSEGADGLPVVRRQCEKECSRSDAPARRLYGPVP